jgi:pimeloyl-ACP methyl ester carboxylesterase
MILALLDYLKVGKFLICGHSMGSIFMPFLNAAAPKRVIGLISITGIVDYWYIGLVSFYTLAVTQLGITKGWDPKLN